MSNSFNQKNIEAFLTDSGATEENARFVADFMMAAVRSTFSNAEIKEHKVKKDFSACNVVLVSGTDEVKVDYAVKTLGTGFCEHVVTVTNGEEVYGLSRLIHTPLEDQAPLSAAKAKKADALAEEENVVVSAEPVEEHLAAAEDQAVAQAEAEAQAEEVEDAEDAEDEAEDAEDDNEDETKPKKAKKAAKKK